MRTTIDRAGRVVISPGLSDGEVEISYEGAGIRIALSAVKGSWRKAGGS